MNWKISPRLAFLLTQSASLVDSAKAKMPATPEAANYRNLQAEFTEIIVAATNSAKRVEDLVRLEMALQEMDKDLAHTEQERGSIDKAQTAYRELAHTLDQMRNSPEEYLKANLSISSQDVMKMPDVRGPMKIRGNKARLRNRAMFSTEEDGNFWTARVGAADRTESLLRALHRDVITDTQKENP